MEIKSGYRILQEYAKDVGTFTRAEAARDLKITFASLDSNLHKLVMGNVFKRTGKKYSYTYSLKETASEILEDWMVGMTPLFRKNITRTLIWALRNRQFSRREAMAALGLDRNQAQSCLRGLVETGKLLRLGKGMYRIPDLGSEQPKMGMDLAQPTKEALIQLTIGPPMDDAPIREIQINIFHENEQLRKENESLRTITDLATEKAKQVSVENQKLRDELKRTSQECLKWRDLANLLAKRDTGKEKFSDGFVNQQFEKLEEAERLHRTELGCEDGDCHHGN